MIDQSIITNELSDVIEVIKKALKFDKQKPYFKTIPEFSKEYVEAVDMWDDVKIHSRGLMFPDKLFGKKAPNEDDLMYEYRRSIYEAITKPDYRKGCNNYNRVFNPQNYAIEGWGNDENEFKNYSAKDYFLNNFPYDDSIIAYFRSFVKSAKLEDPNGVIALWIENYEAPDTELRETTGKIYNCDQVIKFDKDFALLMSDEKSVVKYYNKDAQIGFVFYIYDDTYIYRAMQVGNFSDYEFEIDIYFQHNLGYIPVAKLKGIEIETGIYQSHIFDAIPPLNDILFDNSTLQASKISHAYPIKWEVGDECDNPACVSGFVREYDDEQHERSVKCSMCGGTGKSGHNPLGVYTIKRGKGIEDETPVPTPPLGFVSMDSSILEFLRSEIDRNTSKSFSFLGVDISMTNAKGTDTALGKIIDREDLFSALLDFSNEIWDLLEFTIDFCGKVRYGVNTFVMPTIKKPTNFTIRTEQDITDEYAEANKNNLPDAIKSSMLNQYQNVRFGSDGQLKMILTLKQLIDRLYLKGSDEIGRLKALNLVYGWECVLHDSFDTIIMQKVEEQSDYLNKNWREIQSDLIAESKALEPVKIGSTESIIQ
jgi:hypothetical protein